MPKRVYRGPTSPKVSLSPSQVAAVKEIVKGQVDVGSSFLSGQTYTQGTAVEVDYRAASGSDRLLAYWRFDYYMQSAAAGGVIADWWIVRYVTADGVPDLDTATVLEQFQKDRRILKRGNFTAAAQTYSRPAHVQWVLRNLRIPDGETVSFVVFLRCATKTDIAQYFRFEQRELEI